MARPGSSIIGLRVRQKQVPQRVEACIPCLLEVALGLGNDGFAHRPNAEKGHDRRQLLGTPRVLISPVTEILPGYPASNAFASVGKLVQLGQRKCPGDGRDDEHRPETGEGEKRLLFGNAPRVDTWLWGRRADDPDHNVSRFELGHFGSGALENDMAEVGKQVERQAPTDQHDQPAQEPRHTHRRRRMVRGSPSSLATCNALDLPERDLERDRKEQRQCAFQYRKAHIKKRLLPILVHEKRPESFIRETGIHRQNENQYDPRRPDFCTRYGQ